MTCFKEPAGEKPLSVESGQTLLHGVAQCFAMFANDSVSGFISLETPSHIRTHELFRNRLYAKLLNCSEYYAFVRCKLNLKGQRHLTV